MPITDLARISCDLCRDTTEDLPWSIVLEELQTLARERGWSLGNLVAPVSRWSTVCPACQEAGAWE